MSILTGARARTLYAQLQTGGPRVINNSSGTWTTTNAAQIRADSWSLDPDNSVRSPKFKTGNSSSMRGIRGRQGASGTLSGPLIPSGAAGTAPDNDVILQSIMGKAPTTVTSVSNTYALSDALLYLFLAEYNKTAGASSPTNDYLLGAVPTSATFTLGGDFCNMSVNFAGVGRGDSVNFSSFTGADVVRKGGLTAYPVEPGGLTQNGYLIPGFGSTAGVTFGGSALAELRGSVAITINTGISTVPDGVNDPYYIGYVRGERSISVSQFQCIDSDGSILNTQKQRSFDKTPIAVVFAMYGIAGSTITFTLNNIQYDEFKFTENGDALDVLFPNALANETTIGALDDFTIAFS